MCDWGRFVTTNFTPSWEFAEEWCLMGLLLQERLYYQSSGEKRDGPRGHERVYWRMVACGLYRDGTAGGDKWGRMPEEYHKRFLSPK